MLGADWAMGSLEAGLRGLEDRFRHIGTQIHVVVDVHQRVQASLDGFEDALVGFRSDDQQQAHHPMPVVGFRRSLRLFFDGLTD